MVEIEILSSRERVLKAALGVFLKRGYNGANLRQIASAARVSMGGIYHHFDSKEEIFRALLLENSPAEALNELITAVQRPEFPENLESIGRMIQKLVSDYGDFFRLMYIDVLEFQGRNMAPVIQQFRQGIEAIARLGLKPRIDDGSLRPVPPGAVTRALLGIFLHNFLEDYMLGFEEADEGAEGPDLVASLADILRHGIEGRKNGEEP